MTANPLSFASAFLKNWQVDNSVAGGTGVTALVVLAGAVAVAAGVTIPPIGLLGLTAATPLTMAMVMASAAVLGHLATALLPASTNQNLTALATKLNVSVAHLASFVPQIQASYPQDPVPSTTVSNINK